MKAEGMDGRAVVTGSADVRRMEVRRVIDAPIEQVWSAVTEPAHIEHWWGPAEVEAREGGRIRIFGMGEDCGEGAAPLDGRIKVFQRPYVFEYSWNETDAADNVGSGVVRFDLVELATARTLVTLTNFVLAKDLVVVAVGWHELVERLDRAASSQAPVPEDRERTVTLHNMYAAEFGSPVGA
jgi:uncharacterized protein YndB with AHSA1/START domain